MTIRADWISATAEAITALGLILAYLQLRETHKQVLADHERSRREGAVQYLLVWTNGVSRPTSSASRVADSLDFDACQRIVQRQEVEIDVFHRELITTCFPVGTVFREEGKRIILNVQQSAEVRSLLIKHLNLLETVLCAWWYGSVRKDIIEKEFAYLLEPREGRTLLKYFRQASGDHKYPAIAAFELHMSKQRQLGAGSGGADYLYAEASAPQESSED